MSCVTCACVMSDICVFIVVTHSGTGIRNAWKMNNADKDDKVYILYAKSAHTKQQWMNAFMNERQTVREDYQKGYKPLSVARLESVTVLYCIVGGFVLTPQVKKAAIAIGLATANGTVRRRSMSKKSHGQSVNTTLIQGN